MATPEPVAVDLPWQAIVDQAAGPVAVLDLQGRYAHVNPAGCCLLGYPAEEFLGRLPSEFTYPGDSSVDRDTVESMIQGPEDSFEVEKRFLRSDGSVVWTLLVNSLIRDADGHPRFVLSQVHDITARREQERRWQQMMTNAPIGMALVDLDGRFTEVNDRLCVLLGYSREELVGKSFLELTYPADLAAARKKFVEAVAGHRETVSVERRYRHKDGHPLWMFIRASVVLDAEERPTYVIAQFETIGEYRGDKRLAYLALHDPLTGLVNRTLLLDRLTQEVTELPCTENRVLAVLLIDLDQMKPTNDRYGHAVGDTLLTTTADALLHCVRPGDTVARYGGDEFVVLANVADLDAAEALRQRIAQTLNTEIVTSGYHLSLRASVGLSTTKNPTTSPEALLHEADRDMYARKHARPI